MSKLIISNDQEFWAERATITDCYILFTETNTDTPGPGQYQVKSEFESNMYMKSMDEKGTYLSSENGHLNMKKQIYSKFEKNLASLRSI